jgi:hypothetical protein
MSLETAGNATPPPNLDKPTMAQPSSEVSAATEQASPEDATLLGLPVELQKTIVEYVCKHNLMHGFSMSRKLIVRQLTTNEDKKNVCLVCKQLQTIATSCLYRDMEIVCKFLGQHYLDRIKKARPGMRSVRTLRIVRPWTMGSSIPNKKKLLNAICSLLSAIPKNSLTRFVYFQPEAHNLWNFA